MISQIIPCAGQRRRGTRSISCVDSRGAGGGAYVVGRTSSSGLGLALGRVTGTPRFYPRTAGCGRPTRPHAGHGCYKYPSQPPPRNFIVDSSVSVRGADRSGGATWATCPGRGAIRGAGGRGPSAPRGGPGPDRRWRGRGGRDSPHAIRGDRAPSYGVSQGLPAPLLPVVE